MKDEQNSRDSRDPKAAKPASRAWTRPSLVEYGHLAKLTRGSSGTHVETGGMKPTCL